MWKDKQEFINYLKETWVFKQGFTEQLNYAWQKPFVASRAGMSYEEAKSKLTEELDNLANVMADWYLHLGSQGITKMEGFLNHLRTCDDATRKEILTEKLGFSEKTAENINAIRANYPDVDLLAPLQYLSSDGKWIEAKNMLQQRKVQPVQPITTNTNSVGAKPPTAQNSGSSASSTTGNSTTGNQIYPTQPAPPATSTAGSITNSDKVREEAEALAANGSKYNSEEQKKSEGLAGLFGEGGAEGFLGKALDWIRAPNGAPALSLLTMLFTAIMSAIGFVTKTKDAEVAQVFGQSFTDIVLTQVATSTRDAAKAAGLDIDTKGYFLSENASNRVDSFQKNLIADASEFMRDKYKTLNTQYGGNIPEAETTKLFEELAANVSKKIKENFPNISPDEYTEIPLQKTEGEITRNGYFYGNKVIYLTAEEKALFGEAGNKLQEASLLKGEVFMYPLYFVKEPSLDGGIPANGRQ